MKTGDIDLFERLGTEFPSLIPLIGKRPIEKEWQTWCSEKKPFKRKDFNGKNAGIPCGPANGIIVVDVDNVPKFSSLCKRNGWNLPFTRTHQTGTGKPHYIYSYPVNGKQYCCRSTKDENGDSIFDVRGIGGQVVAPGSIHPDTGNLYTVLHDVPITQAPQWLLDLATKEDTGHLNKQKTIDWNGGLNSLRLSQETRKLIFEGEQKGMRSEAIMKVLNALVGSGLSDEAISSIFNKYSIGEKYHEKNNSKESWLKMQIEKARKYVSQNSQTLSYPDHNYYKASISAEDLLSKEFQHEDFIVSDGILPREGSLILAGEGGGW